MMRGGHLDISRAGRVPGLGEGRPGQRRHTGGADAIPAVGGAMDLASGAKQVFVMMELTTREGQSKLVPTCAYPLTGVRCVSRVYTDVAVFDIRAGRRLRHRPLRRYRDAASLERITGLPLRFELPVAR